MQTDTTPDTEQLLRRAIERREQVVATYNGRRRAFCPHALGRKGDKRHVLAYQFEAEEQGWVSAVEGWRCMDVGGLEEVTTRPGEWHTATNIYNPQSCMDEVEVVVGAFPPRARTAS